MAELSRWQTAAKRIRVPMGFVVTVVFLALAKPSGTSLLLSLGPVAAGLGLRGYASGYVRKNAELTVTGPYAHTRNPLYLGSLLMVLGFAAAAASWILLAVLMGLFAMIYIPTIQGEEAYLRERFQGFAAYAAAVPRLWPRLRPATFAMAPGAPLEGFSGVLYREHREYNAGMGAGAIYLALVVRFALEQQAFLPVLYRSR